MIPASRSQQPSSRRRWGCGDRLRGTQDLTRMPWTRHPASRVRPAVGRASIRRFSRRSHSPTFRWTRPPALCLARRPRPRRPWPRSGPASVCALVRAPGARPSRHHPHGL